MGYEKVELIRELKNFLSDIHKYVIMLNSITNDNEKPGKDSDTLAEVVKLQRKLQIQYGELEHIIMAISGKPIEALPFQQAFSTKTLVDAESEWQYFVDSRDMIPVLIGKVAQLSDNQYRTLINPSDVEILLEYVPKVFIAHGGESKALEKLCNFLKALGIEPVVAEVEPSGGRLTEGQVDECMADADCAIILATYGYIVDKKTGDKHPRLNVVDELGRCRKTFANRTILLLQSGVELPSNVSGIVYEQFVTQSMDKAFIKVAKELTKFGLLRAVKIE